MSRAFHSLTLAILCAVLLVGPGVQSRLQGKSPPGARIIYDLYATDGYVALEDGSKLHIYGFIGGREGEPLTYLDERRVGHL